MSCSQSGLGELFSHTSLGSRVVLSHARCCSAELLLSRAAQSLLKPASSHQPPWARTCLPPPSSITHRGGKQKSHRLSSSSVSVAKGTWQPLQDAAQALLPVCSALPSPLTPTWLTQSQHHQLVKGPRSPASSPRALFCHLGADPTPPPPDIFNAKLLPSASQHLSWVCSVEMGLKLKQLSSEHKKCLISPSPSPRQHLVEQF